MPLCRSGPHIFSLAAHSTSALLVRTAARGNLRRNRRPPARDRLERGRARGGAQDQMSGLDPASGARRNGADDEGRLLASLIPDCRFVQLDSENHMPLADEPAWPRLVDEVRRFLAEPACADSRKPLPLGELTPRERAVLEGIAEGLDNTEIAASLGLSEKTVATTSRAYSTRSASSTATRRSCAPATPVSVEQTAGSVAIRDICPGRRARNSSLRGPSPQDNADPQTAISFTKARDWCMPAKREENACLNS